MDIEKILGEDIPIFIRESLDDTGNHLCVNYSPDIVVQKIDLSNPLEYLKRTYYSDISQDNDGSGNMKIYVRFKNVSDRIVENFYIHLYRNHLCLYNNPSEWQKYEMKTKDGNPVKINSLAPGEIGVTPPFIYEKSEFSGHPNCFVVVATKEKNPDFSSINNYDKYKEWVNQKNVAARNVCVNTFPKGRNEQWVNFSNMESKSVLAGIYVKVQGETPSKTKYGLRNDELGINEENVFVKNDKKSAYIFSTVIVPANFSGEILIWSETAESGKVDIQVFYWKIDDQMSDFEQCALVISDFLAGNIETKINYSLDLLGGCRIINIVN